MSFGKDLAKKCVEIAALTIVSEGTKAFVQAIKAKMFIKFGLIEIIDDEEDDEDEEEDDDEPEDDKEKEKDSGVSYRRAWERRRRRKL